MKIDTSYYVYAYVDPRDYEIVYIGKGKGERKNAHFARKEGSAKEERLYEIKRAGLEPNVRVIAASLTEEQALLVEKALIWSWGESLANVSGGFFAEKFRPRKTLHTELPGFDTKRGIFFVNMHEYENRRWDDARKYGYVAAGFGRKWSEQLDRLEVGSIVAAYVAGAGYAGIGRVTAKAVPARDFRYRGRPLKASMLAGPKLLHHPHDDEKCDYLVGVDWINSVSKEDAVFRSKSGLFTPRLVVASLAEQMKTLEFLEQHFRVKFNRLLAGRRG